MSLEGVMRVSGSALAAHTVWLDTVASNLANSEVVSGSAGDIYRSRQPIFAPWWSLLAVAEVPWVSRWRA